MITRFPKDWNILYVEPSFWLAAAWSIANRLPFRRRYMAQENIEVVSVFTIPFADKLELGRKCNDKIIVGAVKKILKKKEIDKPVLLFYKPRYSCVIEEVEKSAVCYDITDDIMEFDASGKWLAKYTKTLESKSDVMFTPSENILKRLNKDGRKNVFLVGNGVEASHFAKSSQPGTTIAHDIRNIKAPIIGYVGAIGEWFDFELLQKILDKFPNYSIVLVGWAPPKQKRILNDMSGNLHFLGPKKYETLPSYIKAFDVCVIPFRLNKLTQSVNPNKFYEYLAAGKPIVTIALPELAKFSNICRMARNHEEFLEHIKAVADGHISKTAAEIAAQNDWSLKAAQMVSLIRKFCTK